MISRPQTLVLALLGVAIVLTAAGCGDDPLPRIKFAGNETCPTKDATAKSPSPPNVNSRPPVGQAIAEMPSSHIAPPTQVKYTHNPPTSGCHYSLPDQAPVKPGYYDKALPPEYWVHNLEHGYIVVFYNCPAPPDCSADRKKLQEWYRALPPDPGGGVAYAKVIILPWPPLPLKAKSAFAVASWDWYDSMDSLNIDEIQRFYDNHVNQSTEGATAP